MAVEGCTVQVLRTISGIKLTQVVWTVRKGSSVSDGGYVKEGYADVDYSDSSGHIFICQTL